MSKPTYSMVSRDNKITSTAVNEYQCHLMAELKDAVFPYMHASVVADIIEAINHAEVSYANLRNPPSQPVRPSLIKRLTPKCIIRTVARIALFEQRIKEDT